MALANVTYNGDGIETNFAITFAYLDRTHIAVSVDGVDTTDVSSLYQFSFVDDTHVLITAIAGGVAVASPIPIKISRVTPTASSATTFADGAVVRASALNANTDQLLYIAQEVKDQDISRMGLDTDDKFDAQSKVIKNVANPVNAQDAATKHYLENTWLSAADKAQLNSLNLTNLNTVAARNADIVTVAARDADIGTVAARDANIGTVAARDANIGTVASRDADIATVAARDTDIGTVAARDTDIGTVAGVSTHVTTVAGIDSDVTAVSGKSTEIGRLGTAAAVTDLGILGTTAAVADMNTLAAIGGNITTVADISPNVTTVAGVSTDVTSVAGISTDVTTLANALSSVTTYTVTVSGGVYVLDGSNNPALTFDRGNTYIFDLSDASNSGHPLAFKNGSTSYTTGVTTTGTAGQAGAKVTIVVDAAAPSSGLIYYCTVHGNAMGNSITTVTSNFAVVSSNIGNINTVAGSNTEITSVATSIANVNSVAGTLAAVTSFNDLFEAGTSAPTSPSSGDLWYDTTNNQLMVYVNTSWQVAGSYLQGLTSTHVFTATAAQTTFTTDDASQTMTIYANGNTLVFKNGIRLVEGADASTNDYHISGSSVVLNAGATAGDILYVEVFTKISTTQEASLDALVTSATTQANTATTQATASANSATAAAASATTATTQATAATTAKTASETAKTAAETAKTAAEAAFDSLDDKYLGAKSSAPSTDNDGDALATGAIYWNSTGNTLQVWDGSSFQQGAFTAGSLLANVVEDTTPVLGGSLDVGTNSIVSVSNRDINVTPNGTGSVVLDGLNYPQSDGTTGQFLKTDGSGQLSFGTVSTPSLSSLGIANHNNLTVDGSGNVALGASSVSFGTSKWAIVLDGDDLDFQYNGTTVFKLASSGAVTSANDITAFGSP
tara:strand:- start:268 stop:2973 length:2706 start_codon:yes stop_codon:yes gene_type:complete